MKTVLLLTMWLAAGVLATAAAGQSGVKFVGHEKMDAALNKGGTVLHESDLVVMGSHRDKPGEVEMHDKETDVLYMLEGEATFVTGGTGVGMKRTTPGQWLGSSIKGGETHHLVKGDVMVVPAGTPHWFKEVTPPVNYFVVKVLKP